MFNCLKELERPEDTELLIITDGDKNLERAVDKRLDSISYKHFRIIRFGDEPAVDLNSRRYRISAIHNQVKHYVPDSSEFVYLIEDDTVYPKDTLTKMLESFDDNTGIIEGVELGRWKTKYIGAWYCDDYKHPTKISSMIPIKDHDLKEQIIEPIDAGGLYCCLTKATHYKQHVFEPYDQEGTNGLSCDVNFGLYLRRLGYENYIDWSIQCDHIGEKGSVNLGNTKPSQVVFTKVRDKWLSENVRI